MNKKVHWSGGLTMAKARMLPGWPCCCSGSPAEKIAAEGNQTRDLKEVTCKRCLSNLRKAGVLED